jgi:DNA-3-methyladenine glycosylase
MEPLHQEFYTRNPDVVAQALLGKTLVRHLGSSVLSGIIVETEAYFGGMDPASRAFKGRKSYNAVMFEAPGRLFVYMVHGWWLLNVVAHREGETGAVLIRALEPTRGLEIMFKNRSVKSQTQLTTGPGKLTQALNITKNLNGHDITSGEKITILDDGLENIDVATSNRIGVTHDLPQELRFFIRGNRFVSR